MELIKLGKKSQGVSGFSLISNDKFGYNVECSDKGGTVTFNNLQVIEWLYKGKTVNTTPQIISGQDGQNFSRYTKVVITKAKEIAPEKMTYEHNEKHLEQDKKLEVNITIMSNDINQSLSDLQFVSEKISNFFHYATSGDMAHYSKSDSDGEYVVEVRMD